MNDQCNVAATLLSIETIIQVVS